MNYHKDTGGLHPPADLSTTYRVREVTLRNRVVVSPMCQYVAADGMADDWHLVHLGSRAAGGAGLVFVEATAVTPDGRITPGCLGLWDDRHVEPLARVARFVERQGAVPGIQLAHAGRKASRAVPWEGGRALPPDAGGWPVVGPSPVAFGDGYQPPREMSRDDIRACVRAFAEAAGWAVRAGFKVVELHAAHGYLLHSFLSPLSNRRTDHYGGSFAHRTRLLLEVIRAVRAALPDGLPLFVRVSATDWADGGWDVDQTVELAALLRGEGVDLVDCSSGGLVPAAAIPVGPGYQVPFARAVRERAGVPTAAVGLITDPRAANEVVTSGAADLVCVGRAHLRNPYWAIDALTEIGADPPWPTPYGYAVRRR
ncbi:MAG: NADH:flavin oxidoreductase/NADH oxidase [Gemmataceae bacterium]|nr:NADH:flavin oxidoreductase/NADH oxidase [Gemmataceae bacterium]